MPIAGPGTEALHQRGLFFFLAHSQLCPNHPAASLVYSSLTITSSCGRSEALTADENELLLVQGSVSALSQVRAFRSEGPKVTANKARFGDSLIPCYSGVSLLLPATL